MCEQILRESSRDKQRAERDLRRGGETYEREVENVCSLDVFKEDSRIFSIQYKTHTLCVLTQGKSILKRNYNPH